MKLTSCTHCGVVVDLYQIDFPDEDEIRLSDGSFDATKSIYDEYAGEHLPAADCPVCGRLSLLEREEEE